MNFTVNGESLVLRFGMKAARELDKIYKVDYQGMQFGMGVNMALMNLQQFNPVAIQEVITAALSHLKSPPKHNQIEDSIEEYAEENDGLGDLFKELADEMGKSPTMKATIENFKKTAIVVEPEDPEDD